MSTVEFHRQAADDARKARDAAPNDEARAHYEQVWVGHFTAMNHMAMLPHYVAQATTARRERMRLPPLPRRATLKEREEREQVLASLENMEQMPDRHRAQVARWEQHAAEHAQLAANAASLGAVRPADPVPEESRPE